MALNWDLVTARLTTRGPEGSFLSAITGEETDLELRALVVRLAHGCPLSQQHPGCPFCALSHLYHLSLQNLLNSMTRTALASLFELECEVRNAYAAGASLHPGGEFVVDSSSAH